MYHTLKSLFLILLSSLMFLACQEPGTANHAQKISLLYNQHAYFEEGPKLPCLLPRLICLFCWTSKVRKSSVPFLSLLSIGKPLEILYAKLISVTYAKQGPIRWCCRAVMSVIS